MCDDARSDFDAHAEGEDARQDGASRHTAFELVDLCAGFVHVEGADDDKTR